MASFILFVPATLCLLPSVKAANWIILSQRARPGLKIMLTVIVKSWRMNVKLNNIRKFEVVLEECT